MGNLSKQLKDVAEMDTLISIRQYTRVADATGGWVETPSFLAEDVWAKIEYTAQSDEGMRGENQQMVAWNRTKFTFRDFWPTLSETMRIVFDGDEYDILNISRTGRTRFVIIEAEKRDNET
jgi:head-tail adaptor